MLIARGLSQGKDMVIWKLMSGGGEDYTDRESRPLRIVGVLIDGRRPSRSDKQSLLLPDLLQGKLLRVQFQAFSCMHGKLGITGI